MASRAPPGLPAAGSAQEAVFLSFGISLKKDLKEFWNCFDGLHLWRPRVWVQDPASQIQDPGSRILGPGPWVQDPGSRIPDQEPGSWIQIPDAFPPVLFIVLLWFCGGHCSAGARIYPVPSFCFSFSFSFCVLIEEACPPGQTTAHVQRFDYRFV